MILRLKIMKIEDEISRDPSIDDNNNDKDSKSSDDRLSMNIIQIDFYIIIKKIINEYNIGYEDDIDLLRIQDGGQYDEHYLFIIYRKNIIQGIDFIQNDIDIFLLFLIGLL